MTVDSFYYYRAHQEEIVKGHIGEFVAIHDRKVLGYYKNRMAGIEDMADKHITVGTFIVHKCEAVDTPDLCVTDIDYRIVQPWEHQTWKR
jgi:hypothetical protein